MRRSPKQNTILHALIGALGIDSETKETLVFSFTGGRETSSAKMTVQECQALIDHLNKYTKKKKPVDDEKAERMKRRIIAMCHEMGWEKASGKIDMDHINNFCKESGYLHKPLDNYTAKELPKLIYQFEKVYNHYLENV